MAPSKRADPSSDEEDITVKRVNWDGTPSEKVNWYYSGRRTLFDSVPGSRRFFESGTVIERSVERRSQRSQQRDGRPPWR